MKINIYLDDERNTPEGFVRCFWPEEVIELLESNQVNILSLDHDLGDDNHGTGYDVLLWLEEKVFNGFVPPKEIKVHSANISARDKMQNAIQQIYKIYGRLQ